MNRFDTFAFLTAVCFIVFQLLIAYQVKLVVERLDDLERASNNCDLPVDEPVVPQRAPWPEAL